MQLAELEMETVFGLPPVNLKLFVLHIPLQLIALLIHTVNGELHVLISHSLKLPLKPTVSRT
jgi:hypothetical protein